MHSIVHADRFNNRNCHMHSLVHADRFNNRICYMHSLVHADRSNPARVFRDVFVARDPEYVLGLSVHALYPAFALPLPPTSNALPDDEGTSRWRVHAALWVVGGISGSENFLFCGHAGCRSAICKERPGAKKLSFVGYLHLMSFVLIRKCCCTKPRALFQIQGLQTTSH
eukprot:1160354-Pelagomonas_calceolata.AAC.8